MKKRFSAVLAAAALVLPLALMPQLAETAVGVCDPQRSSLCSGLVEWWNFEEASDATRLGSAGDMPLYEADDTDVSYGTGAFGSTRSAQLTTGRLLSYRGGGLGSYWTVSSWVWPNTAGTGTERVILTNETLGSIGSATNADVFFTAGGGGWTTSGDSNVANCVRTAGDSKILYKLDDSAAQATVWTVDSGSYAAIPIGSAINSVTVSAYASRDATGTTQIKLGTELGGTQVLSSALSLTSTAYAWYSGSAQTTKPGGGAWTRQDLANMKLVVEMVANAIGRTARVDVLKAVVNYTPVSGYEPGITIGLASDNKVKVVAMQAETDTYVTALSSAALTASQWNLVAVTMSPGGDFGKNQACISVNGGTLSCTALGYVIRQPASSDLVIGAKSDGTATLNGYLDGLLFAVRPWSQSDVSAYYNSGTGRAFPFY